ncbi:MAG TPA: hypothetical protein VMB50_12505 [Myxococcales bacterium]|nr:hypothetical protein [Myxococcales bacterium]
MRTQGVIAALILLLAPPALARGKTRAQIVLEVKPTTAELFIDGKAMGKASAGRVLDVTAGFHVVKLVSKGDEHEERVKFAAGEKTTYKYEFDEGTPNQNSGDLDQPTSPDSP